MTLENVHSTNDICRYIAVPINTRRGHYEAAHQFVQSGIVSIYTLPHDTNGEDDPKVEKRNISKRIREHRA